MDCLLSCGGAIDVNCKTNKYRSTPLHFAAFHGYLDCCRLLIFPPNPKKLPNGHNDINAPAAATSVHSVAASSMEQGGTARAAIGAVVDARDAKGMTPLHYAIKRGHEDVVHFLLQRYAYGVSNASKRTN